MSFPSRYRGGLAGLPCCGPLKHVVQDKAHLSSVKTLWRVLGREFWIQWDGACLAIFAQGTFGEVTFGGRVNDRGVTQVACPEGPL